MNANETLERTGRRFDTAARAAELARRVAIRAELAALPQRSLGDSTFASTAVFTIAQVTICAVIAALFVALR